MIRFLCFIIFTLAMAPIWLFLFLLGIFLNNLGNLIKTNDIKQLGTNLVVCSSKLLSVCLGGHPQHSVAQRTGRAYLAHKDKKTPRDYWFRFQRFVIDLPFKLAKLDISKSVHSLRMDSGAREIWIWER